jgi:hypothetical protein
LSSSSIDAITQAGCLWGAERKEASSSRLAQEAADR